MSRSAHAQSTYLLRALPHCPRCKKEMVLIASSYEGIREVIYEWECTKCKKTFPKNSFKEEGIYAEESFLNQWCENERKRYPSNSKRTLRSHKQRRAK